MLAENADPKPKEVYVSDVLIASLDLELKLPATVTKDKLRGLRAERSMLLDDVIALLTGSEGEPATAEKCWHAAVWLFKQAAKAPQPVASGTRDRKEMKRIEPDYFLIPRCLGSKHNSIRTDIARVDDDTFSASWREPLTQWHDVRFDTAWLDTTVRALKPRSAEKPVPASEAATRRAYEERIAVWTGDGKPSEEDDFAVLEIVLGQPVHRDFREIRRAMAPNWVKRGRPPISKSARK